MTIKVSNSAHNDMRTPNIERSPSLPIIPREIKVVPIAGRKWVKGSGRAIITAQSNVVRAKIFSPGP